MPKIRFLVWGVACGLKTSNLFGAPVLYRVYYSLAREVAFSVNTTCKIWFCKWVIIQPLFSCTHGIIISLCLICYIQCRLSIACLSIPGIAASDRCKISNSFTFSFQFQSPAVLFIYIALFGEDLKRIGEIGERKWCEIIFICSKISLFNFSGYLFLMIGIYCDCCY